ncbi:MAG: haloacid dehalogenase [Acidobacteria bacterium]|nr:MAG: haloacid dehalogenase [Acidobacteriota bacterium]
MKLELPGGSFRAYLFDCDGTIVDSMPLHFLAWKRLLAEWNFELERELFYSWGGIPDADIIAGLKKNHGLSIPFEDAAKQKERFYCELLPQLKAIPEVLEHIEARFGEIPYAVVSGGERSSVTASLTTLGLLDKFDTIVCAGDYEKGKPDPEPFLVAAARLGVRPEDCLVFEDAELGIQSAVAAGMAFVRVPTSCERGHAI